MTSLVRSLQLADEHVFPAAEAEALRCWKFGFCDSGCVSARFARSYTLSLTLLGGVVLLGHMLRGGGDVYEAGAATATHAVPRLKGVAEIVPTFETAFARVRAYAVCECHKGLYYHHVD